jgi:hypothetical protein
LPSDDKEVDVFHPAAMVVDNLPCELPKMLKVLAVYGVRYSASFNDKEGSWLEQND